MKRLTLTEANGEWQKVCGYCRSLIAQLYENHGEDLGGQEEWVFWKIYSDAISKCINPQ